MATVSRFPVEGRTVVEVQETGYKFPSLHGETYNKIMADIQKLGIQHADVLRAWDEFDGLDLSFMEGLTPAEKLAAKYVTRPWMVSKAFKLLDLRRSGLGNVSCDESGNWSITGKIQRRVGLQPAEMQDDLGMKLFKEIMHYTKDTKDVYVKALIALRVLASNFQQLPKARQQGKAEMLKEYRSKLLKSGGMTWVEFWDFAITPILDKCHGKSVFGWSREFVKLDHTEAEKAEELDGYPAGPVGIWNNVYYWGVKELPDGQKAFHPVFTGKKHEELDPNEADFASDNNIKRAEDFQAWKSRLILADVAMKKATRLDYTDFTNNMVELRAKARYLRLNLQKELDLIQEKETEIYQLRNLFQEIMALPASSDKDKKLQEISTKGKAMVNEFKLLESRSMFEGGNWEFFMSRNQFYPNWFTPENLPAEKPQRYGWPEAELMHRLCKYSCNPKCKRNITQLMVEAMNTFPDKSFEFLYEQYILMGGKPGKLDYPKMNEYIHSRTEKLLGKPLEVGKLS